MRNFVLDFLFHHIKIVFTSKTTRCLLLQVLANHVHQFFGITQVNEAARDNIRASQQPPRAALHRQYHYKHTLLRHMDTVFQYHLRDDSARIVIHHATSLNSTSLLSLAFDINFNNITGVTHKDILPRNPTLFLCQPRIVHQHVEFTVNWHIVRWVQGVNQLNVVVIIPMARQV